MTLDDLMAWWHRDTAFYSSTQRIARHPAVAEIEAYGEEAVAYIIDHFRNSVDNPGSQVNIQVIGSFGVLARLTGENPVQPEYGGVIREMARRWVEWWDRREGDRIQHPAP